MINVAIIEDENAAATELSKLIEQFGKERGNAFAVTRFTAAEQYDAKVGKFDILFIDIELPGMDGMSAARRIREKDEAVIIIFVTNMSRLAIEGYSVNALDYIVKPVTKASLFAAMTGALKALSKRRDVKIAVSTPTGDVCLSASEITYVEVFGHSLVYHTGTGEVTEWAALSKPEKILSPFGFVRAGKSYLVNLRYVTAINGDEITVAGHALRVGRAKSKSLLDALNRYMNE